MKELTCIVCPIGCSLNVKDESGELSITGNKCRRGGVYAQEEIRAPKRTVTATCKIDGETGTARRVPVKTSSPCPREMIPALLDDIYKARVTLPVKVGDVVIPNWKNEGIDIICTRTLSVQGDFTRCC
jgi:CxxC motif-containing protein